MTADATAGRVCDLLRPPLASAAAEVVVASGHEDVLREAVLAVADAVDGADGGGDGDGGAPGHVRLLGTERVLEEACDHFLTASRAADLVDAGRLSLRATGEAHLPSVVVTTGEAGARGGNADSAEVGARGGHSDAAEVDESSRDSDAGSVTSLSVLPGGDAVALRTSEADVVAAARGAFERSFADADAYEVAAPGYSRLLESLETAVCPEVRADVEHVLADGVSVRCSVSGVDEIDTVLLLGGRNGAQLFELSEWAEELGVASRATMSSRKRQLEAAGLLTTEKIRTDVGRPRQRLLLDADGLRDAPPSDVVRTARDVLAER